MTLDNYTTIPQWGASLDPPVSRRRAYQLIKDHKLETQQIGPHGGYIAANTPDPRKWTMQLCKCCGKTTPSTKSECRWCGRKPC